MDQSQGLEMRGVSRKTRIVLAAGVLILGCTAEARGFEQLPVGAQVNDDPASGIDHEFAVGQSEPTNSDVVGGALSPSKPAVPWAIFQQGQESLFADEIFVRSFEGGNWSTRGSDTVGGLSSGAPEFSGSLNFDQTSDAEAPAIDFAGPERTVKLKSGQTARECDYRKPTGTLTVRWVPADRRRPANSV